MTVEKEQNWEPLVYTETFKVTPEMIDDNHHFNNVWSVQWIQDISKNHSEQCGGTAKMRELNCAWMIHEQHIVYRNQAFLGDEIKGTTWVDSFTTVVSKRKCRFERISDGKIIFESETQWVLVDVNRGRPKAIPADMIEKYGKMGK